jgi:hypothetical protein
LPHRLSRCGVAARSPRKGRLLQTQTGIAATPASSGPAQTTVTDQQLMGAEITFGTTLIGHVEGLVHDPVSLRVRRLITSYGLTGRRVAVPMEWVATRTPSRLVLGVGARSLDDLAERMHV